MRVNVHLLAFQDGRIREVEIPQSALDAVGDSVQAVLELAFEYGQNDFQPVPGCCSVSVGDVIEYADLFWVVMPCGFKDLSVGRFETYKELSVDGRRAFTWGG